MSGKRLLSTDPQAGKLLSTDPAAGQAPAPASAQQGHWEDLGMAGARWHPPPGAGSDLARPDNSLFGLPPELAVASGLGVGRAVAGKAGGTMARAWAGAKAAADQAAPAMKYEVAKTALEKMGMPSSLAMPIAMVIAGVRRGVKPAATSTPQPAVAPAPRVPANATGTQWGHVPPSSVVPPAARVSPAVSTPAAPTPAAAPIAGTSAPRPPGGAPLYPQKIQNELGIQARRQKVTLTEPEYQQAEVLVRQGHSPAEAVAKLKLAQPTTKVQLNAAESKEFLRLTQKGKTPEEAYASIELQRGLAARLGTPTPEKVRQAVAERNATGRWRKE